MACHILDPMAPEPRANQPHHAEPLGVSLGVKLGVAPVCCTPVTRVPLSAADAVALAQVVKAIADPARLRLLSLIASHSGGEACVCDLVEPLGLSQPTVSHHLRVLVDAGLLTRDKRGVWAFYALVPGGLGALARVLDADLSAPEPLASLAMAADGPATVGA